MQTDFFFTYISVIRVASGPRVKLFGCESALKPQVVVYILLTVLRRWSRCCSFSV